MGERKRVIVLILIMFSVTIFVTGVVIYSLYRAAFHEEEKWLIETAQSQARLIEAIARFDTLHSKDYPQGAEKATLHQIIDAHSRYEGFGKTGEFTLAKLDSGQIIFMLRHRHSDLDYPKPIPFDSWLAEPMRRALSGLSGTVIGYDYRGKTVLAAHEPVDVLDLGIVAKIDLAEIRAPFLQAGWISGIIGLFIILIGAGFFIRVTNPMLRQLSENERQFRGTFEQAAVGIVHCDIDGRYTRVNQRFCDIVGYTQKELLEKTFQSITHPDDLQPNLDQYYKIINGDINTYAMEKRYIKKDGTDIWINLTVSLIRDRLDRPDYFIEIIEDISDRKKAEEERDRIVKLSRDLICIAGMDGYFKFVNPAWEKILGYSRKELMTRSFLEFIHPDDHTMNEEEVALLASGKDTVDFENRYIHKDGSIRTISWRATPLLEEKLMYCIGRDITDQKRAQEALRAAKDFSESLIETANAIVLTLDENANIITFNAFAERLTGYHKNEVMGKNWFEIFIPRQNGKSIPKAGRIEYIETRPVLHARSEKQADFAMSVPERNTCIPAAKFRNNLRSSSVNFSDIRLVQISINRNTMF